LFVLVVAVGILILGSARAFADTQHFPTATQTSPATNPCSGAQGMLTETLKGVSHTTIANGVVHFTGTFEGTFVFTPNDSSQPTYTGHETAWDGGKFNVSAGVGVDHFTFSVTGKGSDGSHVQFHENAYATIDANGNPISIKFDKFTMNCG
jgi:hypothetical protein